MFDVFHHTVDDGFKYIAVLPQPLISLRNDEQNRRARAEIIRQDWCPEGGVLEQDVADGHACHEYGVDHGERIAECLAKA